MKRKFVRLLALWGGVVCLVSILLIVLPGCGGGGGAETYYITGVLQDAQTGQPIDGAKIQLYQAPTKRVIAGALLLGEAITKDGGKYSIPIHTSLVSAVFIFKVEPPSGSNYQPLEMETNIDPKKKKDIPIGLIPNTLLLDIQIIPPLPPGESYIAGQTYTFHYKITNKNTGQELSFKGVNWYVQGDVATIDSSGNFVAQSPATCIVGIIFSTGCEAYISIPIIAPPKAILCASGGRANELKTLLQSAGFNVDMQNSVPTNMGDAKVLVIDESATLSTNDATKVEKILNNGGNIVLIGDAPVVIATGNHLPPWEQVGYNPTDISTISSWFGAKQMSLCRDYIAYAQKGRVPLPSGLSVGNELDLPWDKAVVLRASLTSNDVSVDADCGGPENQFIFAFDKVSTSTGRLYWQYNYKQDDQNCTKVTPYFINGVKWSAGLLAPQPQ